MLLDISRITDTLYISAHPKPGHVEALAGLPTDLLLSMRLRPPRLAVRQAARQWLHLPCVDSPLVPIPMRLFQRGVLAALPVVERGGIVVVHCHYGRHRSVAMACCILIGQGYPAADAMKLAVQQRPAADPYIWYIRARIERFAAQWNKPKENAV